MAFLSCSRDLRVSAAVTAPVAPSLPGPPPLVFREGATILSAYASQGHYFIPGLATGNHTITVEVPGDANYETSSATFQQTIQPLFDATIDAGRALHPGGIGFASVRAYTNATFTWTITNGTILAGHGTHAIRFMAGTSGEVRLDATIARTYCNSSATATLSIVERAPGASLLYILTPCRVLDTRYGTVLGANETRVLNLANVCGIPSDAKAISANVTTVVPSSNGWLSLYPSDVPWPGTSVLNYRTGRTRANNSVIALSPGARMSVKNGGPAVHMIIDVSGYFQ
jgi:hypothetical protein